MPRLLLLPLLVCGLPHAFGSESPPDISVVGVEAVKQWSSSRLQEAESGFSGSRMDSPTSWNSQVIYQIQVDRYQNGNLSNDALNIPPIQQEHQGTSDPEGIQAWRHGGDIAGIKARLGYLSHLGVTALWLTPLLKHDGSYHGYCTVDPTQLDPGFGTMDELRELISSAHSMGIRVILDVVINHLCDPHTSYNATPSHTDCANGLNGKFWSSQAGGVPAQGQLEFSTGFFGPFRTQEFFNRCGADSHQDMAGTDPVAVYGDFTNTMFDYNTRDWDFQQIFADIHKWWIAAADFDGFRLDAAKHVTQDYLAYFSTDVRKYAATLGKKNFLLVGEVAAPATWEGTRVGRMESDPNDPDKRDQSVVPNGLTSRLWNIKADYLANQAFAFPGLNAVYDFAASGTARSVLLEQSSSDKIQSYYQSNDYNTVAGQADPTLDWTMLEIHDWPRYLSNTAGAMHNPYKSVVGLAHLLLQQGTPIIYYGLEQGFNGQCPQLSPSLGSAKQGVQSICSQHADDSLNRQDMFAGPWILGSAVPALDQQAYVGTWTPREAPFSWQQDPILNTTHEVFIAARKFVNIRLSCIALQAGISQFSWVGKSTGSLFGFSRVSEGKEVVVLINPSATQSTSMPAKLMLYGTSAGVKFVNLLDQTQTANSVSDGGSVYLSPSGAVNIGMNGAAVFVPASNLGKCDEDLGTCLCKQ